jgi:hypothetical protein
MHPSYYHQAHACIIVSSKFRLVKAFVKTDYAFDQKKRKIGNRV